MFVAVVADPLNWDRWPEAAALLEPARARGDFPTVIEPDEELFAVLDENELLAAATAWFDVGEKRVEVKLIGGRNHHRWLKQLDEVIGAAASRAGARTLVAIGRRGWLKSILRLGWVKHGEVDEETYVYSRELKD